MAGAGGGRFLLYYAMPLFLLLFLPLLSSVPKVFSSFPPSFAVATPRRARRRKTAMDTRLVGGREDGEEALVGNLFVQSNCGRQRGGDPSVACERGKVDKTRQRGKK